ncbi:hypothetical protein HMPREF1585_00019 [Gardnerella vaginalis JCP8481B]|uniref:Uncharacterized protein n=1 Tax=Gardnerella vaginalis TaxID=2702 RepID=A0A133P2E0_GARVA|nr:hypothetical protein HMPREF1585_00019 [Gardnerella vaginalis JCP8481B]KXA22662.1 hypothetical protein HMPREF3208_00214 [Gardnerella vaginalis]
MHTFTYIFTKLSRIKMAKFAVHSIPTRRKLKNGVMEECWYFSNI